MVHSLRQAQAAEMALRARVAKAMAQIEELNQRGRGKKHFIEGPQQTYRHLTALSALQQRILEVFGFSFEPYTRLCTVSSEPP